MLAVDVGEHHDADGAGLGGALQLFQRQLREPTVQAEPRVLAQVEARLAGLLARKSQLQRRIRTGPARNM